MSDKLASDADVSAADELVDALLDEGELLDEGGFTIDADHARAKLAHGLADSHSYVIVIARAALMRGATEVDIEPGWTRTRVCFDGRPLREEELRELASFRQLASDRPGDAASRRALTQAAQAALGAGPPPVADRQTRQRPGIRVRVLSSYGGRLAGFELDADDERPCVGGRAPSGRTTVVEIEHRRTLTRLGAVLALATPEHCWTRHALSFAAPARVRLAGHPHAFPGRLSLSPLQERYVDLGVVGLDGFAGTRSSCLTRRVAVVVGGIRVACKPLPGEFEHIQDAIVRDDGLRLDAGGFEVVADSRWQALLDRLREADASWPALRGQTPPSMHEPMWLDPTRERPLEPAPDDGTWAFGFAAVALLALPLLTIEAWFTPGAVAVVLSAFVIPLGLISRRLLKQRRANRRNFVALVPSVATLVAASLLGFGVGVSLILLASSLAAG